MCRGGHANLFVPKLKVDKKPVQPLNTWFLHPSLCSQWMRIVITSVTIHCIEIEELNVHLLSVEHGHYPHRH